MTKARLRNAQGDGLPVADQIKFKECCAGVDQELLVVLSKHLHTAAVLVVVNPEVVRCVAQDDRVAGALGILLAGDDADVQWHLDMDVAALASADGANHIQGLLDSICHLLCDLEAFDVLTQIVAGVGVLNQAARAQLMCRCAFSGSLTAAVGTTGFHVGFGHAAHPVRSARWR